MYTFLDGFDDRLDKIISDIIQLKSFPTVEQAYAYVLGKISDNKLSLTPLVKSKKLMTAPLGNQGNKCCCDSSALLVSKKGNNNDWIVGSGATDHMTFYPDDFVKITKPMRTSTFNANGVMYPITGAGIVDISSSISLPNTLLVPSLSNKLIYMGQATEELNCVALMYPKFCLFRIFSRRRSLGVVLKERGYTTWTTSVRAESIL